MTDQPCAATLKFIGEVLRDYSVPVLGYPNTTAMPYHDVGLRLIARADSLTPSPGAGGERRACRHPECGLWFPDDGPTCTRIGQVGCEYSDRPTAEAACRGGGAVSGAPEILVAPCKWPDCSCPGSQYDGAGARLVSCAVTKTTMATRRGEDRAATRQTDAGPQASASSPPTSPAGEEGAHLGLLDDADHEAKIDADSEWRKSELRIQALGAAISRRDWHAVEQAHAAIRDKFYSHRDAMRRPSPESGLGADITALVDRFLSWPLPKSVCADLCATRQGEGRSGTNLLSATEARQMLEYLFDGWRSTPASNLVKEWHSLRNDPRYMPGALDKCGDRMAARIHELEGDIAEIARIAGQCVAHADTVQAVRDLHADMMRMHQEKVNAIGEKMDAERRLSEVEKERERMQEENARWHLQSDDWQKRAMDNARDLEAAEAERDACKERLEKLARWIVREADQREGRAKPFPVIYDHACARCGGSLTADHFVCAVHMARDFVASLPAQDKEKGQ